MDKNLISIIIPAYNAQAFLEETLTSIINQTYSSWEAIIVNDGSKDKTSQVVQTFSKRNNRIKLIEQANAGQGAARNTGIKHSKGEWIAFLDADDLWMPMKLAKQLAIIEKYDVDVIYNMAEEFSDQKGIIKNRNLWHCHLTKGEDMFQFLYSQSGIVNSSVLVKKQKIEEVGFLDESRAVQGTEDWDLWLRLAKKGAVFYGMADKLVRYRIHEGGVHLNTIRMLESKKKVYKKYHNDLTIPRWKKLQRYRFVYRELIRAYSKNKNWSQVKVNFLELVHLDNFGLVTLIQSLMFKMLSISLFSWISLKFILRLGYRYEYLYYKLKSE